MSESRGPRAGSFGAAVRCAASALAAGGRLRTPEKPPASPIGPRREDGASAAERRAGSSRQAQGPREWSGGAEAPKGALPRWAT